tara:strand:- start:394 stop:1263 length:870 start_codon:yes stop_codon:yes gene_type:complete
MSPGLFGFKKLKAKIRNFIGANYLKSLRDILISYQTTKLQKLHDNPLNSFGKKCFSQTDEDGITLEIIKRLGIKKGVFAEFGVGNGCENNTLILASLGWKGFWVGGENLNFTYNNNSNFNFTKGWVTKENSVDFFNTSLKKIKSNKIDLLSIDLDGNDYYILEELLSKIELPNIIITEYNAKFPPPVLFKIKYDPNHKWNLDDYFGASLCELVNLMKNFSYKLVCCNSHTGSNAFFVKNEFSKFFEDVPNEIEKIYVGPRYHLYSEIGFGHKQSKKTIEEIFRNLEKQG